MPKIDSMTGLHNIDNALEEINKRIASEDGGSLLLLDVECFKQINDTHGHYLGDRVLMECARILQLLFSREDIISRIDSDRFLVFTSADLSESEMQNNVKRLRGQIRKAGCDIGIGSYLSLATGYVFYQSGDTAQAMLERAEILLDKSSSQEPVLTSGERAIITDVKMIWSDLREHICLEGAYCQDYEAFKSIYRFVERGLVRTGGTAHAILFSLTDEDYNFLPLEERPAYMERLSDTIRVSLRNGDAYTTYSSNQFIVMVLGTDDKDAAMIANRIITKFNEDTELDKQIRMDYIINPLKPNRGDT